MDTKAPDGANGDPSVEPSTLDLVTAPASDLDLDRRTTDLLAQIADGGPLIVAFSGGVDSSVLAVAALKALGPEQVLAVTADSPSLGSGELDLCRQLASDWGLPWLSVKTDELHDDRYIANNGDRCYWCKSALMDQLEPLATERTATVSLGVNVDDLGDHRPGQLAAAERGAVFPLVAAGFAKAEIRALAARWDLSVWDRPAMPCLSSRLPYGTVVTVDLLSKVDRAERALHGLGFEDLRVRHYDETARIELPSADLIRATELAADIVAALGDIGYRYVTLDLAGLASGNLNQALNG